jgi:hypothetical protein
MENRKTIDVSLNVAKLREQQKYFIKGKKGEYLDLRLIELENKEYNDFMVVVKVPKEAYEAGEKGDIVGHAKDWSMRGGSRSSSAPTASPQAEQPLDKENLPF